MVIGTDVIYAFEIGNENDHNAFGQNFADYYSHYIAIVNKIRSHNLPVKLCGPATVHPTEGFLKDFMDKGAQNVNFITTHDYFTGLNKAAMDNKSVPELLDNRFIESSKLATHITDSLVSMKHMHYRISECNNYADGGVGVSEHFASALWGLDFMFTVAQNNAMGVNFHGGGAGFTPILVKKGQPVVANPLYYAMLFFHLASQGQLLPVDLSEGNPNFKAYAVLGENKKVYVTLINKDINNSMNVKLSAQTKYATGKLIRLSAPSVYSLQDAVSLAGAQVDALGKWKQKSEESVNADNGKFTLNVPAGSAALLTISN
jgi:alpha-L-arabinofuranosidase